MNGLFFLNVLRALTVSAILGAAAMLWNLTNKVAVLEERVSQVITRSDRKDEALERQLTEIERYLEAGRKQ